jgi:tetratricopeptide (TPR) repeat protein
MSTPEACDLSYNSRMKIPAVLLACSLALASRVQGAEQLGSVSFPVTCAPSVSASFSRGVALLHDFWYQEAQRQFEQIATQDPDCAMAHWGIAMSIYHQIWERPSDATLEHGRREMKAANSPAAKSAREREYIAALSAFYDPQRSDYQSRVATYSADMAKLYQDFPLDTDAGAFYALSLLATQSLDDTTLALNHRAMAVLTPLFAAHPDHPGVVHYIIHACDTPALAPEGLAAARHYGEIAASGPHAVHMPGHIFARLGMWQEDIDVNEASVAASHAAEARNLSGQMDQFHANDFLLYAYLQSGQDAKARAVLKISEAAMTRFESMSEMGEHYMAGMFPYYRTEMPIIFDLEMRDWKSAAALEPIAGAPPETRTMTYWARAVAAGHLHQARQARASVAEYESLLAQIRMGKNAYLADSTGARIVHGEMLGWAAFAEGNSAEALKFMRDSADLQDKVGQREVDIPAREMLADILLELKKPQEALAEYTRDLALSPNRFNGLFNAGMAAELAGDGSQARGYYAALLKTTDNGAGSARPELEHAKSVISSATLAAK